MLLAEGDVLKQRISGLGRIEARVHGVLAELMLARRVGHLRVLRG